jgi:hypothetical protein
LPWVVKSSAWSAESGGVPESIVIVPPAWALELLLPGLLAGLLPELDAEELQAASAATAPQSNEAPSGLRYLFIQPSSQFAANVYLSPDRDEETRMKKMVKAPPAIAARSRRSLRQAIWPSDLPSMARPRC